MTQNCRLFVQQLQQWRHTAGRDRPYPPPLMAGAVVFSSKRQWCQWWLTEINKEWKKVCVYVSVCPITNSHYQAPSPAPIPGLLSDINHIHFVMFMTRADLKKKKKILSSVWNGTGPLRISFYPLSTVQRFFVGLALFCTVGFDVFLLVQMVGGWTCHYKSCDTRRSLPATAWLGW